MSLRLLLVRHGAHDLLGRVLCGRMDGVALNTEGLAQADRLGTVLARDTIAAVYASPLLRAQQTAAPIAQACGLPLQTEPALNEIDVGAWTGATFAALDSDPHWPPWNADRLHHRPPKGESMLEAQCRVAAWIERMATDEANRCIVAVSHADVIKAACCHALGLSVDAHGRFDVDAASITTVLAGPWGMKLTRLNAG